MKPITNPAAALLFVTLACVAASTALQCESCKPVVAPAPDADASPAPPGGGCVTFDAIDPSGVLQTICADIPTILAVAELIVPLFAAKPGDTCVIMPGTSQCFTNAQRLQILYRLRAADAGAK